MRLQRREALQVSSSTLLACTSGTRAREKGSHGETDGGQHRADRESSGNGIENFRWLAVGFECRHYSKLYARIKEILDSGEIGTLRHINCQYVLPPDIESEWRHNSDLSGGIFCEKLCHYVDLPRWWVGDRVCRYFAAKADNVVPHYEVADNIELTYQFDCGVVSHLSFIVGAAARVAKYADMDDLIKKQNESGYELSYRLVGTEGAIESDIYARELKIYHHAGKQGFVGMADLARIER